MRRALGVATLVAAAFLALPAPQALAHPLGNFTVSRYGGLEISNDRVTVHYVVDMAEIPAFQEKEKIDANHDGDVDRGELGDYATSLAPTLRDGISVSAGGDAIALAIDSAQATLRPGQGGLEVLRIDASFSGPLDSPSTRITYIDTNYAQRIGWQEVVAYAVGAQGIVDSTVPSTSVSNALRSYPKGRLASPLDVDSATVTVGPGAGAGNPAATGDGDAVDSPGADGGALADRFTALIGHDISLPFLGFALLLAFAAGALHALGPGHGKSIMAAYLVGTEGRFRHALLVGIAVSVMHTASVVALGLLVLGASRLFTPEAVFPWLSLVSGVVVLGLGVYMLKSRLAARRDALHQHAHDHSHGHEHTHSHGGRTHSHAAPAGVSPTSWKGLGVIALSGGLLPSPSALVVLLGAVALHRVFFGVVLVAAFSVGLAAALTAVGLLVIKARSFASRRYGRRITVQLPVLSAAAILTIGVFLTAGAALKL